jgi:hypothetical protein
MSTPEPRSTCHTTGCTDVPAWRPVLSLRHARRAAAIDFPLRTAVCERCHHDQGLAWYLRNRPDLYRAARSSYQSLVHRTPSAILSKLAYRAVE